MTDDNQLEDAHVDEQHVDEHVDEHHQAPHDGPLAVDEAQVADAPQPHPMTPGLGVVGKFTVPAQAVNDELTAPEQSVEQ